MNYKRQQIKKIIDDDIKIEEKKFVVSPLYPKNNKGFFIKNKIPGTAKIVVNNNINIKLLIFKFLKKSSNKKIKKNT